MSHPDTQNTESAAPHPDTNFNPSLLYADRRKALPREPSFGFQQLPPFWRTRKGMIAIIVVTLVIITAIVGGAAGGTAAASRKGAGSAQTSTESSSSSAAASGKDTSPAPASVESSSSSAANAPSQGAPSGTPPGQPVGVGVPPSATSSWSQSLLGDGLNTPSGSLASTTTTFRNDAPRHVGPSRTSGTLSFAPTTSLAAGLGLRIPNMGQ